jgi:hypothetical protein
MSDVIRHNINKYATRMKDMGDGTHAEVVSVGGSVVSGMDVPDGSPLTGQAKIAVTGTAVPLSATSVNIPGGAVFVTARVASTYITVGDENVTNTADGTGEGQTLRADESIAIIADDIANVYINGTQDDWVSWSAR